MFPNASLYKSQKAKTAVKRLSLFCWNAGYIMLSVRSSQTFSIPQLSITLDFTTLPYNYSITIKIFEKKEDT